jgi:hypothetical protein
MVDTGSQHSMSFIFEITLAQEDALSKDDLKRWHPTDSRVVLHLGKSLFSKRGTILAIGTPDYGAAGLLTDNADPDAEYWDMNPALLPDLVKLLKIVRENTKSCFEIEAYWIGERLAKPIQVSVDELGRLIEQGKISTKAHFLVC